MADASDQDSDQNQPQREASFAPTQWTELVDPAGKESSPEANAALAELCRIYWYPLYVYVRRRGYSPENAEDLTQGFFEHILERNFLGGADRKKGKFRSFLLASLNYYLSNEREREQAQKRGGGKLIRSLDEEPPEDRYAQEPVSQEASPEAVFEGHWAMTVLHRAKEQLQQGYAHRGKEALFERLKLFLAQETGAGDYRRLAQELGLSSGSLATAVSRLRHDYRKCVRDQIARTVTNEEEIEGELRHLISVLSSVRGVDCGLL